MYFDLISEITESIILKAVKQLHCYGINIGPLARYPLSDIIKKKCAYYVLNINSHCIITNGIITI